MKIINPTEITDTRLTSSTVPEDYTVSEWVAGTYNQDDEAYYNHIVYRVAVASTTDRPDQGAALDPPRWVAIRPTDRWAMFDERTGTKTTLGATAEYVFTPWVRVNSIAFIGLSGVTDVQVVVESVSGGGVVFDETLSAQDLTNITDWYEWHFAEFRERTRLVVFSLPNFVDAVIKVTFNGTADAKCGNLVLGNQLDLGITSEGMTPDIRSFSVVTEDGFGGTTITRRPSSRRLSVVIGVERADYDYVFNTLQRLVDTLLVYVANPDFESGTVYGYHRRAPLSFGHGLSTLDLQIEGLA